MKYVEKKIWLLSMVFVAFQLSACDNSNKPNQSPTDQSDVGTDRLGNDADTTVSNAELELFCQNAKDKQPIKEKLQFLLDKFCINGKPTSLVANTLTNRAYDGTQEDPSLTLIEPFTDDAEEFTTSVTIATGIKMSVSSKAHFDKVAPLVGNKEKAEELASAQDATATVTIKDSYTELEDQHVRGFKVNSVVEKNVIITTITTKGTNQVDQYQFSDKVFMYTNILTDDDPIEGILEYSQLTANVQLSSGSYLLTISKVTADNRGIPSEAKNQIKKTGKELLKAMYDAAEKNGQ